MFKATCPLPKWPFAGFWCFRCIKHVQIPNMRPGVTLCERGLSNCNLQFALGFVTWAVFQCKQQNIFSESVPPPFACLRCILGSKSLRNPRKNGPQKIVKNTFIRNLDPNLYYYYYLFFIRNDFYPEFNSKSLLLLLLFHSGYKKIYST